MVSWGNLVAVQSNVYCVIGFSSLCVIKMVRNTEKRINCHVRSWICKLIYHETTSPYRLTYYSFYKFNYSAYLLKKQFARDFFILNICALNWFPHFWGNVDGFSFFEKCCEWKWLWLRSLAQQGNTSWWSVTLKLSILLVLLKNAPSQISLITSLLRSVTSTWGVTAEVF